MNIVESRTFELGRFTVRQKPRFDSPGWAQYLVYLGEVLIGKSFSMPDLSCCEWLYQQRCGPLSASIAKVFDVTGATRRLGDYRKARRRKLVPADAE